MRITHDQKRACLEAVKSEGTLKSGAKAAGVTVMTIYNERKRSKIFDKQIQEAMEQGKQGIGDRAVEGIMEIAFNPLPKDIRAKLTALISLANANVPGFRGQTTVQGKIEHAVKVVTGIPRPNYELTEPKKPTILIDKPDKDKLEALNKGEALDTVEKVIEAESVKEVTND